MATASSSSSIKAGQLKEEEEEEEQGRAEGRRNRRLTRQLSNQIGYHGLTFRPFTRDSLLAARCRRAKPTSCTATEPDPYLASGQQVPAALMRQLPAELVGKPIEDPDPFYANQETFVIISRGKELIRFSAKRALHFLGPFHPVRRLVLQVLVSPIFNLLVIATILLNCILMTFQANEAIEQTEIFFTIVYTTELGLKVLARGFILDHFAYLRDPWNWLDFVVIIMAYLTIVVEDLGNLSVMRTFRVLRALKTVAIIPGMKTIVGAVIDSVKNLKDVVVLTLFSLSVFSLLGLQIYMGQLTQKCILNGPTNMSDADWFAWHNDSSRWLPDLDNEIFGSYRLCGNATGASPCPPSHTCIQGFGPNPDYGYTNFDTFGWALICSFRLMTQDYWEGLYLQVLKTAGSWHIFFFIISIFLGSIYLMNLILAIVAMSYNELQRRAEQEEEAAAEDEANFLESCRLLELQEQSSELSNQPGQASYRPSVEIGLVGRSLLASLCQNGLLGDAVASRLNQQVALSTGMPLAPNGQLRSHSLSMQPERAQLGKVAASMNELRQPARRHLQVSVDSRLRLSDRYVSSSYLTGAGPQAQLAPRESGCQSARSSTISDRDISLMKHRAELIRIVRDRSYVREQLQPEQLAENEMEAEQQVADSSDRLYPAGTLRRGSALPSRRASSSSARRRRSQLLELAASASRSASPELGKLVVCEQPASLRSLSPAGSLSRNSEPLERSTASCVEPRRADSSAKGRARRLGGSIQTLHYQRAGAAASNQPEIQSAKMHHLSVENFRRFGQQAALRLEGGASNSSMEEADDELGGQRLCTIRPSTMVRPSARRRPSRDFSRRASDWSRLSMSTNVDLRRLLRLWSHTNPYQAGGRPSVGGLSQWEWAGGSPLGSSKNLADQWSRLNSPRGSSSDSARHAYQLMSAYSRRPRPALEELEAASVKVSARDKCLAYCLSCLDVLCIWECGPHWCKLQRLIGLLVFDPFAELFIIICILVNTLFMALDNEDMDPYFRKIFERGNYFFTATFAVEAAMKVAALSPKFYFREGWNVFDSIIVALSLLELGLEGVYGLSVLRSFRLLRVFKLAKSWPTLNLLISIMGKAVGDLGNLTFVLAIIVFIFAVMGMQLFGNKYVSKYFPTHKLPRWNFCDFMHSFMIVFRILCAEWIEPMWDCLLVCGWPCVPFFLCAVTAGNLVVLNLFLALLLASFGASNLASPQTENVDTKKLREAMARFRRLARFLRLGVARAGHALWALALCRARAPADECGPAGCAQAGGQSGQATPKSHIVAMSRLERIRNIEARTEELKSKIRRSPEHHHHQHLRQLAQLQVRKGFNYNYNNKQPVASAQMAPIPIIVDEPADEAQRSASPSPSTSEPAGASQPTGSKPARRPSSMQAIREDSDSLASLSIELAGQPTPSHWAPATPLEDEQPNGAKGGQQVYLMGARQREEMEEEDERTLQRIEGYIERCIFLGMLCLKWFLFRRQVRRLVEHRWFDQSILLLIIISSGTLALEDKHLNERPNLKWTLDVLDTVFTVVFSLEMILKWLAFGIRRYFSNIWSWLDFLIVLVSFVNLMASVFGRGKIQALKTMRTLRAMRGLRPLRALQRFQGMRVVVNALIQAIPSIFNVLLVCLIFWLIFSIMGVQMFGGKFWRCLDPDTGKMISHQFIDHKSDCLARNLTWANPQINFDNVLNAYLALFQVATFKGWIDIIASACDARQRDYQPVHEANLYMFIYFVFFVIFGSFFTLNLFIGVIIDNFNEQKRRTGGSLEMFMTDDQKKYYHAMKKMRSKRPVKAMTRPKLRWQAKIFDLVTCKRFELAIMLIISLNMFVMALEHFGQSAQFSAMLEYLNLTFIAIFTLECLAKMFAMRHFYFREPWNVFDFVLVLMSILGVVTKEYVAKYLVSPTLLRVVRVVKVGRVLRLVKGAKGIRTLLFALAMSLPALFNICLLLFLVMFIYAIFGMSFFMNVRWRAGLDETLNFETFTSSIIVLFQMSTSAGWDLVLDPLMDEENDCIKPDPSQGIEGTCGNKVVAIIYLISYVIISFLIIINMYIAVILENYSQATEDVQEGLTDDDYEMYYEIWQKFDPNGTQFLPHQRLSDFVDALEDPLRLAKPNELALVVLDINIYQGNLCYCVDILDALTKHFFTRKGLDIQVNEHLKQVQSSLHETQFERITTTYLLKRQHYCARLIQNYWRQWRQRANRDRGDIPSA